MKWRLLLLFIVGMHSGFAQNPTVDSLKSILPNATKEKRIEVLHALIINLWLNHPDTAIRYAREAYKLSGSLQDVRSQAISIRLLGGVHLYQGTYDSALYYSKWAYQLSVKAQDSTLISSAFNNIGFAYYHLGSYGPALENLLRALHVKYKIKQDYGLGQTLNNIGLVYTKLKNYSTARKYFNEAIAVAERTNDNNNKLYSSNNIGFSYLDQGNYTVAENSFKESLRIAEKVNNTNWEATAHSGLGQVYYKKGLLDRAKKQFKISMSLRKDIGDRRGISEIYYYLSNMYASSGYLDSAFINLRISQQIATQINSKPRLLENYELFKDLHAKQNRPDSALYYMQLFVDLRDQLFNENLARNLADIELKIREEENIQRLAAKDAQIERQNLQQKFLIVIAILTFTFALIVVWYYRIQKRLSLDLVRKNQEIVSQKEEIESQKEALVLNNQELERAHAIIKQQNAELAEFNNALQSTVDIRTRELELANKELKVANLELDNFIYKSSHDIKGPLVRLLGICHVALLDIQDERAREYFQRLHKTSKHINDIFDRLKVVSDINSLEIAHEPIDFTAIYNQVLGFLKHVEGFDRIDFSFTCEGVDAYYSDSFLIQTIFHNMLENAVKFQHDSLQHHKFISVSIHKVQQNIIISFKDNGIGIKESDVEHIFKMFSQAALEHQTVGLGLYTVKQCVSKLGGSIRLLRNKDRLTEFELTLPTVFTR